MTEFCHSHNQILHWKHPCEQRFFIPCGTRYMAWWGHCHIQNILVGGFSPTLPLWKIMDWVSNSWDDYSIPFHSIPNLMGKTRKNPWFQSSPTSIWIWTQGPIILSHQICVWQSFALGLCSGSTGSKNFGPPWPIFADFFGGMHIKGPSRGSLSRD